MPPWCHPKKKRELNWPRVLSESKNRPVKELQVSQVSVHLWLSIVKQLFPRSFDDFFALLRPPSPLLFRALQVQVGFGFFGNAIALQTMFSHFYNNYIQVKLLDGRRVPVMSVIADLFYFQSPFAKVADGCWNGFCSIAKRFRFVEESKILSNSLTMTFFRF